MDVKSGPSLCSNQLYKRNGELEKELYFIIAKFLSRGPCSKAYQELLSEIQDNKLLPKRVDWLGNHHERDFREYESLHSSISSRHLPDLLTNLSNVISQHLPSKHLQPQHGSLLSLGRLSLLRRAIDRRKVFHNTSSILSTLRPNYHDPHHGKVVVPNFCHQLVARRLTGKIRKNHLFSTDFYHTRYQLLKRTVGHLSSVYCVLFDRTGRYILTGSDDNLVKVWSVRDGRLLATLRGASGEISDIAIDPENTMVAAGSCDKTIRVWSLQTLSPICVLISHTGMVTSLQFCPSPDTEGGEGLLVSTGGDGCVAFWTYTRCKFNNITFRKKPLKYNERVRPGHAQLICGSFSAGGTLLAVGGVDHNIRVYRFGGVDGLDKLVERAAHEDCVDSVQWSHTGLSFASGSRDGRALIWRYSCQTWTTIELNMATSENLPRHSASDPSAPTSQTTTTTTSSRSSTTTTTITVTNGKKVLVTMVGWSQDDQFVVTCSSDHCLRVWHGVTGELVRVMRGHSDDAFVIEAHPTNPRLVLTAGHDGQLIVWDVVAGEIVCKFHNTIEGQGHGALFDAKWSPDGQYIAATDSHGHICIFGMTASDLYKKVPQELFFHTDYRPLVRDANQFVLDEQTQLAPHLMPPPFLVNMDGNPYPPALQRLVPGRSSCNDSQLVPNVIFNANGDREVFDVAALNAINALHQQQANENIEGDPDPPAAPPLPSVAPPLPSAAPPLPPPPLRSPLPPLPPSGHSSDSEGSPSRRPSSSNSVNGLPARHRSLSSSSLQGRAAFPEEPRLVDQMIERLVQEQQQQINQSFGSGSDIGSPGPSISSPSQHQPQPSQSSSADGTSTSGSAAIAMPFASPSTVANGSNSDGGVGQSSVPAPFPSQSLVFASSVPTPFASPSLVPAPFASPSSDPALFASSSSVSAPFASPLSVPAPFASPPSVVEAVAGPSGQGPQQEPARSGQDHSYAVVVENNGDSPRASRGGARLVGDVEGVRQSVGDWQCDPNVKWAPRRSLLPLLSTSMLTASRDRRQHLADDEERRYLEEAAKPSPTQEPEQLSSEDVSDASRRVTRGERMQRLADQRRARLRRQRQDEPNLRSSDGTEQESPDRQQQRNATSARTTRRGDARSAPRVGASTRSNREVGRGRYAQDYADPGDVASQSSEASPPPSDCEDSSSSSGGRSTDYSDWTAEQGVNLEPPKRTAHRQKKNPGTRRQGGAAGSASDDDAHVSSAQPPERCSKRKRRKNPRYAEEATDAAHPGSSTEGRSQGVATSRQRREVSERINNMNESSDSGGEQPRITGEIPLAYRPPEWLTETQPKRAPYFPQMGDELMYFMQGHVLYANAVETRKLYAIDTKVLPWNKSDNTIKEFEHVKIIGIKYEIRPPRLCCLKLGVMNPATGRLTSDTFTLKYHDIPDVLDIFVLKQTYDVSAARNWSEGDRFRCIIDDAWWLGTIYKHDSSAESAFLCYDVKWDNGETERLSPWDMEPIDDSMRIGTTGSGIAVHPNELERLRYSWTSEDWLEGRSGQEECTRLAQGLGKVMELAVAEPFLAPVDLSSYPNYAMIVEYPMDLSTIKARLESGFYRRLNAVQFDVRYIATNAERFNQRGSNIVRQARIVTELCLDLIKNPSCRDPTARYHEIASTYHSPNASDLDGPGPSGEAGSSAGLQSTGNKRRGGRNIVVTDWRQQCKDVLKVVFEREDSMPFRYPVDLEVYVDYSRIVDVPMDLSSVREELATGSYESPHNFAVDMKLIFTNSKSYNTNKKSKIYSMTVRLEAFFLEKMKAVISDYEEQTKRETAAKKETASVRRKGGGPVKRSKPFTTLVGGHTLRAVPVAREGSEPPHYDPRHLPQDNDESDDDGSGNRRSKRVARLKRFESSDDCSDEDYSPVKKKLVDASSRNSRRRGGAARPGLSGASSGSKPQTSVQSDGRDEDDRSDEREDSSSESEVEAGMSTLVLGNGIARPCNIYENGQSNQKRVVIKLNLNSNAEENVAVNAENVSNDSTDQNGVFGTDHSESESEAFDSINVNNKITAKRKIMSDSGEENSSEKIIQNSIKQDENGSVNNNSSDDNSSHRNQGDDESGSNEQASNESDSDVAPRPEKIRKLESDNSKNTINSSNSDDSSSSEEGEDKIHVPKSTYQNGSFLNKRIAPNIGRKMPIYKGSLVPSLTKKKKKEESSEFECDDRDSGSSEESEEEKTSNKRRKAPASGRRSRRSQVEQDDYLIDDDEFINNEDDSENSNSSSSEESDSDSDAPRHKKKRSSKHTKGVARSSAKSGKKIPLKYKPGSSSRKKNKKKKSRGRSSGGPVIVRDGKQIIGTVQLPRGYKVDSDEEEFRVSSSAKRKRSNSTAEEVRKSSRSQRKIYYDDSDDEYDLGDNVSSRGRVRRANTLMKDFI